MIPGSNDGKYLGYGRQQVDEADIEAVAAVLRGDHLTQGPAVATFEDELAARVGARYAVAVTNGTAALHLACLAAGLKEGDRGVTQAITFVASANCMAYCGIQSDLVDIDPKTLNMSPESLRAYLMRTPQCRVVIPVAMGGLSHDGAAIRQIVGERILIEDACHALGATSGNGLSVGGGGYADMTVFSFHPVKPITTGEGGAIVTDREDLYQRLLSLRSHGIERAPECLLDPGQSGNPWYYEQQMLGFNYRLSDILAALGRSQLSRLDDFIRRRREISDYYDRRFAGFEHVTPAQVESDHRRRSGHHLYIVEIDFAALGTTRAEVMRALSERGIGTQVHYIPVHHHPYHRTRSRQGDMSLDHAEAYYQRCLTLPCHPGLADADLERIVSALTEVLYLR